MALIPGAANVNFDGSLRTDEIKQQINPYSSDFIGSRIVWKDGQPHIDYNQYKMQTEIKRDEFGNMYDPKNTYMTVTDDNGNYLKSKITDVVITSDGTTVLLPDANTVLEEAEGIIHDIPQNFSRNDQVYEENMNISGDIKNSNGNSDQKDTISANNDAETKSESPEIKMTSEQLVDYKTLYELNNTTRDTTYDNERKEFAENETLIYASGMRVSLNIVPINRYSSSSYITSFEYDKRLSYILGDNDFLRTLFSNTNGLIFPYTPQINMQHNVNYEEVEILHSNLTYQYYKNTPPPIITINADFTADTPENALYMLGAIWFFRSMTKSDFGKKANRGENQNYAGMPPPVLYLNGYGKMYDNIPVIIKSFDTPFQKDKHYVNVKVDKNGDWKVNYLSNFDTAIYHSMKDDIYDEWLPTEMTMQITLAVQPNLKKVKDQFDLNSYKKGILGNVIKNSNGINNLDKSTLYNGSGWTW